MIINKLIGFSRLLWKEYREKLNNFSPLFYFKYHIAYDLYFWKKIITQHRYFSFSKKSEEESYPDNLSEKILFAYLFLLKTII